MDIGTVSICAKPEVLKVPKVLTKFQNRPDVCNNDVFANRRRSRSSHP